MDSVIVVVDLVFLALLSTVGILGNGLIIRVFARKSGKTSTDIFILALAATDLVSCFLLIGLSVWTADVIFHVVGFCRALFFCRRSMAVASVIQTTIIACDRYTHVCNPWRFKFSRRNSKLVVALGLACGFLSQVHFLVYGDIIASGESFICVYNGPNWLAGLSGCVVDVLFVCAIMCSSIAYGSIYWKIKRQRERLSNNSDKPVVGLLVSRASETHNCMNPPFPNTGSLLTSSSTSRHDGSSDSDMNETSESASSAMVFTKNIPTKGVTMKPSRTIPDINVDDVFNDACGNDVRLADHSGSQVRQNPPKRTTGINSVSAVVGLTGNNSEPGFSRGNGDISSMTRSPLNPSVEPSDRHHLCVSDTLLQAIHERPSGSLFLSDEINAPATARREGRDATTSEGKVAPSMLRKERPSGHGNKRHKGQCRAQGDAMTKMLLIYTIIFFITSLPVVVLENFSPSQMISLQGTELGQWTVFLLYQLQSVNRLINGFVYFFVNRRFRRDAYQIFCHQWFFFLPCRHQEQELELVLRHNSCLEIFLCV